MKKLFSILLLTSLICLMTVPIVYAQENGVVEVPSETEQILKVIGAWLIYSIFGLLASISSVDAQGKPIPFDAQKIGKSLAWMVVVAIIAIGLGLNPQVVVQEQANLIQEIVNFIVGSGAFTTLIYVIDKGYKIATNVLGKLQATAEKKTT